MGTLIKARNGVLVQTLLFSITMSGGLPAKAPGEEVRFEYANVVQSTDSQFTNVADINGDGVLDILAFKGDGEGFVSWYEGPDFRHHITRKGNFNAGRPLSADVDRDGDMDLVVAKDSDRRIYWYENPLPTGDPLKATWTEHDVGLTKNTRKGDYIKDYAVADFDGDGSNDIVVCTFDDPAEIFMYFQNDKDNWEKKTHTYSNGHEGLDVGDIDGDGDPDIVTNGRWFETPSHPRTESLTEHLIDAKWHNQSDGWQRNATMIRVADINGNGRLDVVISHSEKEGYPVSWYSASDPKGRWTEHLIAPNYGWCQTLDVGDVDLDGDLDILAARFTRPSPPDVPPPHDIRIYYNRGDGLGVWAKQVVRSDGGLYFGHLADMDADGDLDVVGPRSYWTGPIEFWKNLCSRQRLSLDKWTYIELDANRGKWGDWDEPNWLRYFGLAMADVTGDEFKDIVAGRYFYRNPAGDMTAKWPRVTFGLNVDGMLFVDVDGDALGDVIGQALPDVYWLEAEDLQGKSWKATRIGTLPKTGHVNGQGYVLAQLVPGGRPEVILACGDGAYYFEIPDDPEAGNWPKTRIAAQTMDEGIGVGDVDGDGDIDVSTGKKEGDMYSVRWYENAGDTKPDWEEHVVGHTPHAPDRIVIAEINGDGRPDIVVSEERYPGKEPDANLLWFEQLADGQESAWRRHIIITEYSLNNLDVADLDGDGDNDIVTCEHKGPKGKFKLQIFENHGEGSFTEHIADRGKESHLGARLADMDNDGDLDIVSAAWDYYQYLHVWRNDARGRTRLSEVTHPSDSFALPPGTEWALTFADEFGGNKLDTAKWIPRYQWGSTHNYNAYCDPDNVLIQGGLLRLKVEDKPSHGKKYTSAVVTTYDKFSQKYGYFEGRFKVPSGKGFWPAFWMLPYPQHWPPEIDIFEMIRDDPHVYMTFHWRDGKHKSKGTRWKDDDFSYSKEFHTYGVEWDPEKIVWYTDGVERARFTDSKWIPNEPMYILINFGIDARWPGPCDETTPFPSYYECDWIRVHRKK